jgi:quercetin 2,3-dioxygenase
MLEVRRSRDRGYSDNGWLKTFHSFAFADYFDPEHVEFGPLRVVNEDRIKPGKSFGPHSPQEMEILTFVLHGEIERKNSLGQSAILRAGDVQRLSAGTGLQHSETNVSTTSEAYLLQVWVRPAKPGIAPSVETRHFRAEDKVGRLKLVASPTGESGSLKIQQDARIYTAILNDSRNLHFEVGRGRCAYIHVARGSIAVGETRLNTGDAMKITQAPRIVLHNGNEAEIVLMNLPANRLNAVFQRPRVRYVRPAPATAAPSAESGTSEPRQDHFAMFGPRGLGFALARLPRGFALAGQAATQDSAAKSAKAPDAESSAGNGLATGRRKATSDK